MQNKNVLRLEGRRRRALLTETLRKKYSARIAELIFQSEMYQKANRILTYVSYLDEVSTLELIQQAITDEKEVYCPKTVAGEEKRLEFYRIFSMEDLHDGFRGIKEPAEFPERVLDSVSAADLILIPGCAFDHDGRRLGYGGGFYDRFLEKNRNAVKMALGFSCQILQELPEEPTDIRPDYLVSELGIRKTIIKQERIETAMDLMEMGKAAVAAKYKIQKLSTEKKNQALAAVADGLVNDCTEILDANALDIAEGEKKGMHPGMLDRLRLTENRVEAMAEGLKQICQLPDPLGEVLDRFERPNGLIIEKKRVPLGVIGIIYESRPNVTADAFGLCFKAGNVCILKGGSDAIHSNKAITASIRKSLAGCGVCEDAIGLITDTSREVTAAFMKMNDYVDVLIPRGGAGLIRAVVQNSTVPVIETGTGNCHIYVDEYADLEKAIPIIMNAKTQRIGVCNACESLVVHEKIRERFLPAAAEALRAKNVELRADERAYEVLPDAIEATEEDFGKEYLDYILSIKTVDSLEEAIEHINRYNTGHSDAILTENPENAERFLAEVDAACVYVNASTRFTDGFEFGFGAEIGISTQKLHARGPMGLKELTAYKYAIRGNGQVRS